MLLLQVIADACSEKKAELRGLERNVTALSSATQALHGWIKANEAKIASLPENFAPSDVIVPVDDLSKQAIAAQVRLPCTSYCVLAHSVSSNPNMFLGTCQSNQQMTTSDFIASPASNSPWLYNICCMIVCLLCCTAVAVPPPLVCVLCSCPTCGLRARMSLRCLDYSIPICTPIRAYLYEQCCHVPWSLSFVEALYLWLDGFVIARCLYRTHCTTGSCRRRTWQ